MKVTEKGSDRTAEAHVRIEGKLDPLEEYGEHVDPKDNAICCYIPVDEGDTLKISSRFSGTTLAVVCDAVIDGVCRKTNSCVAKWVQFKKHLKSDFDTFLYQSDDAVLDTSMRVAKIDKTVETCRDGPEIVGSLELHLHVTRQLSIEHDLSNIRRYSEVDCSTDETVKNTGSAKIDPQFVMEFEKNCAALERRKLIQEQKRTESKRPGRGPWVVFRYYYRSKKSIVDQKMEMTYDPTIKSKSAPPPRLLEMEPVPDLPPGVKPANNDGDSSTRASSVPPDVPCTPSKTPSKKVSTPKPATPSSKEQPKSTTKVAPEEDALQSPLACRAQGGKSMMKSNGHRYKPHSFSMSPLNKTVPQTKMSIPGFSAATGSSLGNDNEKIVESSEGDTPTNKNTKAAHLAPVEHLTSSMISGESLTKDAKTVTKAQSDLAARTHSVTPSTNLGESIFGPGKPLVNFLSLSPAPIKKPADKTTPIPNPILTSVKPPQKNTLAPTTPTTPTKRPADASSIANQDPKRTRTVQAPSTPIPTPRTTSASPSPFPMSVELQVAQQRKRLEAIRKERQEMAEKQKRLEKQMEPYKQRMAEELEKLRKEMEDEESALAEEQQRFCASTEMLKEFQNSDV